MSTPVSEPTLDTNLYQPTAEELTFFKSQTGVEDDEELKQHILKVQKEAWDVVPYLCIRIFGFMKLTISLHPKYSQFVKLRDERPGAVYLELACFFGTDIYKAVADGYPKENIVASDIKAEFWGLGHKLFKTTPETFPVKFVQADVLDPNHIASRSPFYSPPTTPRPDLKAITSLTPLQGHVSSIHVGSFFHLFDEETQLRAAHALASLLSPEPGSMIFGHHLGQPTPGTVQNPRRNIVFRHSPETWRELWDGVVFEKGTVEVWSTLMEWKRDDIGIQLTGENVSYINLWCVTRL